MKHTGANSADAKAQLVMGIVYTDTCTTYTNTKSVYRPQGAPPPPPPPFSPTRRFVYNLRLSLGSLFVSDPHPLV